MLQLFCICPSWICFSCSSRQGNLPPDAITCDGSRHKGICADSLSDSGQYGGFARTAEVIFLYWRRSWCFDDSLNSAKLFFEPANKMMNKDSRFSRKMHSNFSTRRHSCIGYVSSCASGVLWLRWSLVMSSEGNTSLQTFRKYWKLACFCFWLYINIKHKLMGNN